MVLKSPYVTDITVSVTSCPESTDVRLTSPFLSHTVLQWNISEGIFRELQEETIYNNNNKGTECFKQGLKKTYEKHWVALYGVIQIETTRWLIGIEKIQTLKYSAFFQCQNFVSLLLPPRPGSHRLSREGIAQLRSLQSFLHTDSLFFFGSLQYDASLTLASAKEEASKTTEFAWNMGLEVLFPSKIWIVPLIYGFVGFHQTSQGIFAIISRRSRFHVGMRCHSRGLDFDSHPANMVETEIVLRSYHQKKVASFVILRGSYPGRWTQTPNGRYRPKVLVVGTPQENASVVTKHFLELLQIYGERVICLDLTRPKELREVRKLFTQVLESGKIDSIVSLSHDVTARKVFRSGESFRQCAKLLEPFYNQMSYTLFCSREQRYEKSQHGVVRVNCLDCVDRTNLVQAFSLWSKIREMSRFLSLDFVSYDIYTQLWEENGNYLGYQYVGTEALFTQLLKLPSQNFRSMLRNSILSAQRYVQGLTSHGKRHDAMLLMTTPYTQLKSSGTRHVKNTRLKWFTLFIIAFLFFYYHKRGRRFALWVWLPLGVFIPAWLSRFSKGLPGLINHPLLQYRKVNPS